MAGPGIFKSIKIGLVLLILTVIIISIFLMVSAAYINHAETACKNYNKASGVTQFTTDDINKLVTVKTIGFTVFSLVLVFVVVLVVVLVVGLIAYGTDKVFAFTDGVEEVEISTKAAVKEEKKVVEKSESTTKAGKIKVLKKTRTHIIIFFIIIMVICLGTDASLIALLVMTMNAKSAVEGKIPASTTGMTTDEVKYLNDITSDLHGGFVTILIALGLYASVTVGVIIAGLIIIGNIDQQIHKLEPPKPDAESTNIEPESDSKNVPTITINHNPVVLPDTTRLPQPVMSQSAMPGMSQQSTMPGMSQPYLSQSIVPQPYLSQSIVPQPTMPYLSQPYLSQPAMPYLPQPTVLQSMPTYPMRYPNRPIGYTSY